MRYVKTQPTASFRDYCEQNGIALLKDDLEFIKNRTSRCSPKARITILRRYCDEWLKGMSDTDIVERRQNLGRRTANSYLRDLKI